LRWLGRRHVDERVISTVAKRLTAEDRAQLLADVRFAPAWIGAVMRRVATRSEK